MLDFLTFEWFVAPYVLLGFLAGFLLMELFWRMLFEYLIAFLQIHEALTTPAPAR